MNNQLELENQSIAEIFRNVLRDIQELLRAEVRLAKAEVSENVDRAKSAGGLMGGAAAAGLFAGMSLVATLIAGLATFMAVWMAALIVTVLLGGAGAFLFFRGKAKLRNFHAVPEQTVETVKEDVEWAKQRTR